VSVSNFKVETSENLENAFYVFYVTLQKTQKVAFFNFEKKRKKHRPILELWPLPIARAVASVKEAKRHLFIYHN